MCKILIGKEEMKEKEGREENIEEREKWNCIEVGTFCTSSFFFSLPFLNKPQSVG